MHNMDIRIKFNVEIILNLLLFCQPSFVISQTVCGKGDLRTCVCDLTDNSGKIDLTSLGKPTHAPWFVQVPSVKMLYFFDYNPCYDFTSCYLDIPGLALAQWPSDPPDGCYGIGTMESSRFVQENGQLSLQYHSHDNERSATVYLECNPQVVNTTFKQYGDDYFKKHITFKLHGPGACPTQEPKTAKHLSAQIIVIIVVVSALAIYLTVGIAYKYIKKRKNNGANDTEMETNTETLVDETTPGDAPGSESTGLTVAFVNYGSTDDDKDEI